MKGTVVNLRLPNKKAFQAGSKHVFFCNSVRECLG